MSEEYVNHESALEALFAFQDECPLVRPTDLNPHFKNRYASLKAIKMQITPFLTKHQLRILQKPMVIGGVPVIHTDIYHTPTTGMLDGGDTKLAHKDDNPQSLGSANTYARRFGIVTALDLLVDEDDDGSAAAVLKAESNKREVLDAIEKIENAKDLESLRKVFSKLGSLMANAEVIIAKDAKKKEFTDENS